MVFRAHIGVCAAVLTLFSSCARLDLEEQDQPASQAQQISVPGAVVLCPLVAVSESATPSSAISIVWAGYPPHHDALQLMRARVSPTGVLLQSGPVADLDSDVTDLRLLSQDNSLRIDFVDRDAGRRHGLRVDRYGNAMEAPIRERWGASGSQPEIVADEGHCETSVAVGGHHSKSMEMKVFRGQVDGDLSLFVQLNSQ